MEKKNFFPFTGQVEISLLQKGNVIVGEEKSLLEAGEVIAVGEGVTFLKVGDIVHFEAFGCSKTTKDIDGVEHYVVLVNENVIRGKHAAV